MSMCVRFAIRRSMSELSFPDNTNAITSKLMPIINLEGETTIVGELTKRYVRKCQIRSSRFHPFCQKKLAKSLEAWNCSINAISLQKSCASAACPFNLPKKLLTGESAARACSAQRRVGRPLPQFGLLSSLRSDEVEDELSGQPGPNTKSAASETTASTCPSTDRPPLPC